jgi:hypothetical protein
VLDLDPTIGLHDGDLNLTIEVLDRHLPGDSPRGEGPRIQSQCGETRGAVWRFLRLISIEDCRRASGDRLVRRITQPFDCDGCIGLVMSRGEYHEGPPGPGAVHAFTPLPTAVSAIPAQWLAGMG